MNASEIARSSAAFTFVAGVSRRLSVFIDELVPGKVSQATEATVAMAENALNSAWNAYRNGLTVDAEDYLLAADSAVTAAYAAL